MSTISWRRGKASWGRLYSCSSAERRRAGMSRRKSSWDRQHRPLCAHHVGSRGPSCTGHPHLPPHLPADNPQGRRCPLSPHCLRAQGKRNQLITPLNPPPSVLSQHARLCLSHTAQFPTTDTVTPDHGGKLTFCSTLGLGVLHPGAAAHPATPIHRKNAPVYPLSMAEKGRAVPSQEGYPHC